MNDVAKYIIKLEDKIKQYEDATNWLEKRIELCEKNQHWGIANNLHEAFVKFKKVGK